MHKLHLVMVHGVPQDSKSIESQLTLKKKLLLTCSRERCLYAKYNESVKGWLVRPHTFKDL